MNRTRILIKLTILLLFYSSTSFGGGWTRPKGGVFAKVDIYSISAKSLFDDDGNTFEIPKFDFLSSNFYCEVGITDRLTGIAYFPFYVSSKSAPFTGNEELNISNTGDLDIGARYQLLSNNGFVLSTSLTLGLPTGSADENELLWTGDGEFNQIIKLEAGLPIPGNIYAAGGLGYNFRSQGFSDEFVFDIEIGIGFFENRLFATLKSNSRIPMENGDEDVTGGYGMFSNNTGYISFGPEVSYFFKNGLGISANTFGAFYGRNLLAAPSYSAGIVYRFDPPKN